MKFPPDVWASVLEDIIEAHNEYLSEIPVEEEDIRIAFLHEVAVLEDMLERAHLLDRFMIPQIH